METYVLEPILIIQLCCLEFIGEYEPRVQILGIYLWGKSLDCLRCMSRVIKNITFGCCYLCFHILSFSFFLFFVCFKK